MNLILRRGCRYCEIENVMVVLLRIEIRLGLMLVRMVVNYWLSVLPVTYGLSWGCDYILCTLFPVIQITG